jgi:hypothetical protein
MNEAGRLPGLTGWRIMLGSAALYNLTIGVAALFLPLVRAGLAAPGTGLMLAGDGFFTLAFIAFFRSCDRRGAGA